MSLRTIFLIVPVIFLAISTSLLCYNRVQSYPYYQRIQFESAGAKLYANLYYPSKNFEFQEKHPLVIYAHGSGWQKDVDIRTSIELTKRGFFVASIDYQAHGESGGDLTNVDEDTGVLGIAQDCSKLLDRIENLNVYNKRINSSQIGLVGHSLGGLVVLMNGALDSRFRATISWAGVVNSSWTGFDEFNPVNLLNETNPQNLLIIHSPDDLTVNYEEHALVAQSLTNCTIINITDSFFSAHYLLSDTVLIETINWYEFVFFGSETINGPVRLSWITTLFLLIITLIGVCLAVLCIIICTSKYVLSNSFRELTKREEKREEPKKLLTIIKFLSSLIIFLAIWIVNVQFFGLSAIYVAPIIIILVYLIFISAKYFIIQREKVKWEILKEEIKTQLDKRSILYSICSAGIFLTFYYLIAFIFPLIVLYPPNIISFMITFITFPLYLSTEITYRKIFFPLTKFIKSRKKRTLLVSILILFVQLYFVFIAFWYYGSPAIIAAFFAFLMASVINSILYHKTNKFSTVLINSIIINGIFFGSNLPVILNLLSGIF